jgi:hypothetical protein
MLSKASIGEVLLAESAAVRTRGEVRLRQ